MANPTENGRKPNSSEVKKSEVDRIDNAILNLIAERRKVASENPIVDENHDRLRRRNLIKKAVALDVPAIVVHAVFGALVSDARSAQNGHVDTTKKNWYTEKNEKHLK